MDYDEHVQSWLDEYDCVFQFDHHVSTYLELMSDLMDEGPQAAQLDWDDIMQVVPWQVGQPGSGKRR